MTPAVIRGRYGTLRRATVYIPRFKHHAFLCQGSLQFFGGHTCGCVLLTADYVLTAAHCTNGRDGNPENFKMRFNTVFWASGGDLYTVSVITPVNTCLSFLTNIL